ncbi:MAG: response regulator, partial [Lentisphaeraceae bacterium]|nr:response regulator [Lentisphaeraceae bacterium]
MDYFNSEGFMPHGHCILWKSSILWTNIISDALIALSYMSICIAIAYYFLKRSDLAYRWFFLIFGSIVFGSCAVTHIFAIWTYWHPDYAMHGISKAVTAVFSMGAGTFVWVMMPKIFNLPSPSLLEAKNIALNNEVLERQNAVTEMLHEKEKAEHANQAKSRFLANMSHEIRTPMNAVLGFAEILKSKEKDSQKSKYISNIYDCGKTLLSLINDILDLSKVEAGKIKLTYSSVSLDSLFTELRTLFSHNATDKGLDLQLSLSQDLPEALILDETRLRQVLVNLCGNAVKFTEQGFIRLQVECSFPEKTHSIINLIIKVQDSGIGIPEDQQEKVFGAFEQMTKQNEEKFGGTGLGLAISKKLVDLMGGSLRVESKLNEGSTFIIDLPGIEVAATKMSKTQIDLLFDLSIIVFEPAKILIADDIEYNRELLQTFLEDYGFEIVEAVDGIDALEKVKELQPDLILLDMKMPRMSGYEVSEALGKDCQLKVIPIIAVTASALKDDEELISELCSGYLRKPVSQKDLIVEVMKHLPHQIQQASVLEELEELEEVSDPLSPGECAKLLEALQSQKMPERIRVFAESLKDGTAEINDMFALTKELENFVTSYEQRDFFEW